MATVSPSTGLTCSKVRTARLIGSMKAASTGETLSGSLQVVKAARHGTPRTSMQVIPRWRHAMHMLACPLRQIHALAAAPQGIQADLVPLPDLGHILADLRHFTGPSWPMIIGIGTGTRPLYLLVRIITSLKQIPAGLHLDQHFTRSGFRDGELAHFKRPRLFPGFHDGFHVRNLTW